MTDLLRLKDLARLMGVRVLIINKKSQDAGVFVYSDDGPEIEIYRSKSDSETETVLSLIHELGHAWDWIEKGRPKAVEIPLALSSTKKKMSPSERRTIYEYEQRAIDKMGSIYELLNLDFPKWKLEVERRFDLWVADHFRKTGKYPNKTERSVYRKALRKLVRGSLANNSSLI